MRDVQRFKIYLHMIKKEMLVEKRFSLELESHIHEIKIFRVNSKKCSAPSLKLQISNSCIAFEVDFRYRSMNCLDPAHDLSMMYGTVLVGYISSTAPMHNVSHVPSERSLDKRLLRDHMA